MDNPVRLISFLTLFLAVALPSIALLLTGGLVGGDKSLARVVFAAVLVVGYGTAFVVWRRGRR